MAFFQSKYKLRRYGKPHLVEGYQTAGYAEMNVFLDVQEEDPDTSIMGEDGVSATFKLKSFGDNEMRVADVVSGTKADLLFYNGDWYECTACNHFEHTILKHYNSTWTRLPKGSVK